MASSQVKYGITTLVGIQEDGVQMDVENEHALVLQTAMDENTIAKFGIPICRQHNGRRREYPKIMVLPLSRITIAACLKCISDHLNAPEIPDANSYCPCETNHSTEIME